MNDNIDHDVVNSFGDEWSRFDQSDVPEEILKNVFLEYFSIFPWEKLPSDSCGFDLGCGSGRWAKLVAPHVGFLFCIDPSEKALSVARRNLAAHENCTFLLADANNIPLDNASMDFGYSLGVLHHIPDTNAGLKACVEKLKIGAPFLLYLYYAFDNRPIWFRFLWRLSDFIRRIVCRLPRSLKNFVADMLAVVLYWPLSRGAGLLERCGMNVAGWPLSYYRNKPFYVLRTDSLDRFGTRLEKRFTRKQMMQMMTEAGLGEIKFSDHEPYWCAVGYRLR